MTTRIFDDEFLLAPGASPRAQRAARAARVNLAIACGFFACGLIGLLFGLVGGTMGEGMTLIGIGAAYGMAFGVERWRLRASRPKGTTRCDRSAAPESSRRAVSRFDGPTRSTPPQTTLPC